MKKQVIIVCILIIGICMFALDVKVNRYESVLSPVLQDKDYIPPKAMIDCKGILDVFHYQQCGQSWSGNQLGNCTDETMCSAGCAVSSTAMLLYASGVDVDPGN